MATDNADVIVETAGDGRPGTTRQWLHGWRRTANRLRRDGGQSVDPARCAAMPMVVSPPRR